MKWAIVLASFLLASCHPSAARVAADKPTRPLAVKQASANPVVPAAAPPSPVELPLKPGVYVSTAISCENASAATVALLGKDRVSRHGQTCLFVGVNRTGRGSYAVAVACPASQPSGRTEERVETWEITSPTTFSRHGRERWEDPVRLCAPGDLPSAWREAQSAP